MLSRHEENALIREAQSGDGRAVEALIRNHQESLYAFMLRMSGRPEVAEDIVQEAFVRVLKNLDRFDPQFRFSTWLFTIAKRLYVNLMQKQRPLYDTETMRLQIGHALPPGRQSAEAETRANIHDLLDCALAGLSAQQREIILLFHQQCWPIADISQHLNMPEGTVKSHLHRARRRMRQVIESNPRTSRQAQEVWS